MGTGLQLSSGVSIYGGYNRDWKRSASLGVPISGSPQAVIGTGVQGVMLQLVTLRGAAASGDERSVYGARLVSSSVTSATTITSPPAPRVQALTEPPRAPLESRAETVSRRRAFLRAVRAEAAAVLPAEQAGLDWRTSTSSPMVCPARGRPGVPAAGLGELVRTRARLPLTGAVRSRRRRQLVAGRPGGRRRNGRHRDRGGRPGSRRPAGMAAPVSRAAAEAEAEVEAHTTSRTLSRRVQRPEVRRAAAAPAELQVAAAPAAATAAARSASISGSPRSRRNSTVATGNGGAGKDGGTGGPGGSGGTGFQAQATRGGNGGIGGAGGVGGAGAGGGGAGGPSIGLFRGGGSTAVLAGSNLLHSAPEGPAARAQANRARPGWPPQRPKQARSTEALWVDVGSSGHGAVRAGVAVDSSGRLQVPLAGGECHGGSPCGSATPSAARAGRGRVRLRRISVTWDRALVLL